MEARGKDTTEAGSEGKRWTYAEFARLPSEGSTRYEVIDGELAVTPSPTLRHQRIVLDLGMVLTSFVREHDLGEVYPGPVDVLFAEGDYFQPDLVFIHTDRLHLRSDRGIEGPPDLVVEITSPSTTHRDRGIKLDRYRLFGVAEYWIVDPEARSIDVWRFAEGATESTAVGPADTLRWQVADDAVLEFRPEDVLPE